MVLPSSWCRSAIHAYQGTWSPCWVFIVAEWQFTTFQDPTGASGTLICMTSRPTSTRGQNHRQWTPVAITLPKVGVIASKVVVKMSLPAEWTMHLELPKSCQDIIGCRDHNLRATYQGTGNWSLYWPYEKTIVTDEVMASSMRYLTYIAISDWYYQTSYC